MADAGSQFGSSAMEYPLNLATAAAWADSDLAALEGGLYAQRFDNGNDSGTTTCTLATLTVVWIELVPAGAVPEGLYTLPMLGVGW